MVPRCTHGAADLAVALNDSDATAGLRGLDRGLLTGGTGSDHHDVEDLLR
jgi:hypothetical protein